MVSEHWHLLSACRPSLPAFPLAFSLRFAAEKKPVAFAAHEHCVLWSKRMTVSSSGAIHPPAVGNVVRKGVQRRCTICSGFGATVECSGKAKGGCPIVYHFECANASKKIALDMVEYRCFCVNHARGRASALCRLTTQHAAVSGRQWPARVFGHRRENYPPELRLDPA